MMDKVISSKWYKDKNVLKFTGTRVSSNFTRTTISSKLQGQKCPQIMRTTIPSKL
jgi:hypothetical protein